MSFIPGNHDCDFERETDTRRMALNHLAAELPSLDPEGGDRPANASLFKTHFLPFWPHKRVRHPCRLPTGSFARRITTLAGFLYEFNLYNTSWVSRKREKQGELLFPTHIIEPKLAGRRLAQLTISYLHHPYNWLEASNTQEFRRIVESTSDIVLTWGRIEHEPSAYTKDLFPSGSLQYFEAPVLQGGAGESSGFNVLHIDTSMAISRTSVFFWKSGMYQTDEPHDWEPLNRNSFLTGSTFPLKAEYERHFKGCRYRLHPSLLQG